jgi:putative membrane-bound dehydrogenase-like protein
MHQQFFKLALFAQAIFASAFLSSSASAQSTAAKPNYASELPRIPGKEPAEAMAEIQVQPGYELQLAAAEPLVRDPVALSFDESGRMFVVEMCDYSEQDKEFLGNIRMLEDTDNDGKYDKSTLYAHHLSWPTGVICYDGGIFVAAAPDIWYIKDTDGDGQSDVQRKVFTGFGRTNVQGLLNSFCWGIDNRIYCQSSSSAGAIRYPDTPEQTAISLSGRDFSFDPKTLSVRTEAGGGQHGMCFDDWGRRFVCQNSDHLQLFLYPDRYAASSKLVPLPASRQSIAADGPQATVYRISPVEPWRLVRTRLRVNNLVPGPVEGGGRAAGYFTSATGITIYRGDAFPNDMLGAAIVGDVGSNIVHRKKLTEQGISMIGHRIDTESEFLAGKDIWFRPVQFANAPDGTLYVADLYREVIEHPRSLPEEIKQHLDLTSGRDRGRIYRVAPTEFKRPPMPSMDKASIDDLIQVLANKNGWHRDTASRMLYERLMVHGNDALINETAKKLIAFIGATPMAQARLHAYGLLVACGAGQGALITALDDPHPRVREWAIQWVEDRIAAEPAIQERLVKLAGDSDPRVRFQLALSLGKSTLTDAKKMDVAVKLLSAKELDAWQNAANLNAIGNNAPLIVESLLKEQGRGGAIATSNLRALASLAAKVATDSQLEKLDQLIASVNKESMSEASLQLCVGLIQASQSRFANPKALEEGLGKLPAIASLRNKLIAEARPLCADNKLDVEKRVDAIQYLMWESSDDDIPILTGLLNQREPQAIQEAATRALMRYQSANVPRHLIKIWTSLSPKLRSIAADVMLSRAAWTDLMLDEAGQGGFSLNDLEPAKIATLRNNPKTKDRVNKLVKSSNVGSRQDVYERYRESLTKAGDKAKGKQVFAKSCSACHRLENVGFEIGPNLAPFQFRGAEAILQNVIEPNREVNPQYVTYTILTNDDRIVTGMIVNESAASITLLRGENQSETIQRSDIAEIKSSKMSLMPEGIENQIDIQSMADLISYLTTLQ